MENLTELTQSQMSTLIFKTPPKTLCGCGFDDIHGYRKGVPKCIQCILKDNIDDYKKNRYGFMAQFGIPKRYFDCSFDNFKTDIDDVKKFIEKSKTIDYKFDSSIFIHSTRPGTGKTHLAVSIIRNLCEKGLPYKPKFVSSPFLFLEIKNSFGNTDENENDIIKKYSECGILIVDDIGVEKYSDWANQVWYMIIDSRYSQMRPTIYTSNLSIGDIASKIDPRIASRLASGTVLNIDSQDYRLKK